MDLLGGYGSSSDDSSESPVTLGRPSSEESASPDPFRNDPNRSDLHNESSTQRLDDYPNTSASRNNHQESNASPERMAKQERQQECVRPQEQESHHAPRQQQELQEEPATATATATTTTTATSANRLEERSRRVCACGLRG